MSTSLYKGIAIGAAVIVVFSAGYALAHYQGKADIRELREEAATARALEERKANERLIEAQNALSAAQSERDQFRADLERMRKSAAARQSRASADACSVERAAVAKCEELLGRGADLVERGADLLQRNAELHDAVITLMK